MVLKCGFLISVGHLQHPLPPPGCLTVLYVSVYISTVMFSDIFLSCYLIPQLTCEHESGFCTEIRILFSYILIDLSQEV